MTTKERWIVGVVLLLLIVAISYVGFSQRKNNNIPPGPSSQPGNASLPAGCDPQKPGYNVYGYKSDICGQAYEPDCDLDRPGFDMNGLPNINCGFGGRKKQ